MDTVADTARRAGSDGDELVASFCGLDGAEADQVRWAAAARTALAADASGSRAFASAFRHPDKAVAQGVLRHMLESVCPTTMFGEGTVASMRWLPLRGLPADLDALHATGALLRARYDGGRWSAIHRGLGFDVDPDELLWAAATAPASFTAACRQALRAVVSAERESSRDLAAVPLFSRMRRRDDDGAMSDGTIPGVIPVVRLSLGPEPMGSAVAMQWPTAQASAQAAGLGVAVGDCGFLSQACRWRFEAATSSTPGNHPVVLGGTVSNLRLRIRDGGCDVDADGMPVANVNRHVMDVVGPDGIAALAAAAAAKGVAVRIDDPKSRYDAVPAAPSRRRWH